MNRSDQTRLPKGKWTGPLAVLGSVNMDIVTRQQRLPVPGETIFGRDIQYIPGGKGLNQAVAAARAGGHIAFVGCIGEDEEGAQLARILAHEGIDIGRLRSDGERHTGIAMVSVLDDGENAIVVIAGANDSVVWSAEDETLLARASALVTQLERPAPLVQVALESARRHGAVTVLTPAPVSEEAVQLLPLVDILLLNEHEAQTLTGLPDGAEAAGELSELCELVIMTRGARSTLVAQRGVLVHEQPTRPSRVVDTTGAGDCFAGTLVARLAAGDGLGDALRVATTAASLSVSRQGASRSMPTWAEVVDVDMPRPDNGAST